MNKQKEMDLVYGGFAGDTSDPIIAWFTQEGCKRGRRNLMWGICLELKDEFLEIREKRIKLRDEEAPVK